MRAFADSGVDVVAHPGLLAPGHQRADVGRLVEGVTHAQGPHHLAECLDVLVIPAAWQQDPACTTQA